MTPPETRYARSGDVRIAYQVVGNGPFDLVFIDADKGNYKNYYEAVLPKLKSGGVILIDNVLWSGAVLDPKTEDDRAIDDLNNHVVRDTRVDKVLSTIRDGVFFIRKK